MDRLRTAIGHSGFRLAGVRGMRLGNMVPGRRLLRRMLRLRHRHGSNLRLGFCVNGPFKNIFALMAAVSSRLDDHIVVIGGIGSITGSVMTSFLYIASLEWLLRGLDTGKFLGIEAPGLFKNGFRMAVISVIIMVVVLFFRKGIMGERELPDLFRKRPKKEKKNVVEEGKADE